MSDDALEKMIGNATHVDGTPMKVRVTPQGEVEMLNPRTSTWVKAQFKDGNDIVEWDPKAMSFKVSNPFPMATAGETCTREYLDQVASKGALHPDANVALETQKLAAQVALKDIENAGKTHRTAIVTFGVFATVALGIGAAVFGSSRNDRHDA